VRDPTDLTAAVEAADEFGGVDIMVNNAAVLLEKDFLDTTEREYYRITDINFKGVFCSQIAAERMIDAGRSGSILNVSSIAGIRGAPELSLYSASKGAVRLLTYALAGELGPRGIRVNAIHPGRTETKMSTEDGTILGGEVTDEYVARYPLGRAGTPEDVAQAALFLVSEQADYINGESLIVDGGMHNSK